MRKIICLGLLLSTIGTANARPSMRYMPQSMPRYVPEHHHEENKTIKAVAITSLIIVAGVVVFKLGESYGTTISERGVGIRF